MNDVKKNTERNSVLSPKSVSILDGLLSLIFAFGLVGSVILSVSSVMDIVDSKPLVATISNANFTVRDNDSLIDSIGNSSNKDLKADTSLVTYDQIELTVNVKEPSILAVLLERIPEILSVISISLISIFLLKILRRYKTNSLFSLQTITYLKWVIRISFILINGYYLVPQFQTLMLLNEKGVVNPDETIFTFPFGLVFVAIAISLLGELVIKVFKDIVDMKVENDATI